MQPQITLPEKFTSNKYIEINNNGKYERYYMIYLNSGMQGTVYKACKDQTDELYAIKEIKINFEQEISKMTEHDKRQQELLLREINVGLNAKHRHTMRIYDVHKTESSLFAIMEYCDNTLTQYMKTMKTQYMERMKTMNTKKTDDQLEVEYDQFVVKEATRLFRQILSGFQYFKSEGIIHRDIKPDNIYLQNGDIKIGDYGFSALLDHVNLDATMVKGTPYYLPPNIITNGLQKETPSLQDIEKQDVWGVGAIFLQMLLNNLPWKHCKSHKTLRDTLEKLNVAELLINEKEFSKERQEELDKNAKDLLINMLQPDGNKRISWQEVFSSKFYLDI